MRRSYSTFRQDHLSSRKSRTTGCILIKALYQQIYLFPPHRVLNSLFIIHARQIGFDYCEHVVYFLRLRAIRKRSPQNFNWEIWVCFSISCLFVFSQSPPELRSPQRVFEGRHWSMGSSLDWSRCFLFVFVSGLLSVICRAGCNSSPALVCWSPKPMQILPFTKWHSACAGQMGNVLTNTSWSWMRQSFQLTSPQTSRVCFAPGLAANTVPRWESEPLQTTWSWFRKHNIITRLDGTLGAGTVVLLYHTSSVWVPACGKSTLMKYHKFCTYCTVQSTCYSRFLM